MGDLEAQLVNVGVFPKGRRTTKNATTGSLAAMVVSNRIEISKRLKR